MKIKILFFCIFFSFLAISQDARSYIKEYNALAIHEMNLYNIPASITLAQGILESGSGTSNLAVEANNHFGIKCHVDWSGPAVYHDDDEKNECFRKYQNVSASFRDHSLFLTERGRYSFLFKLRKNDYKGWAKGLQKAGYATSKTYAKKLIRLINEYDLSRYDRKKISKKDKKKFNIEDDYSNDSEIYQKNYTKYVLAKSGESYDDIAERLDVWLWELLKYNESANDRTLIEGEKVYLQPKRRKGTKPYHIVLANETMYSISQLYGIKLKHLYKKNRMEEGSEPYVGQKISLIKKVKFN
tara:strand:- start:514 stop:1410 length:897 start_codon:yes stop_codon:yes gene_type:complete